jgi:VWFA-related protein
MVDESIDVRVVNVEAVVTDRAGHVVHGLAAADFQLLVDGKEVPIDYFTELEDARAVAPPPAAPAVPPAGPGTGEHGPAPPSAQPQVPPGTGVARNYLVFIDDGFAVGARRNQALGRLRKELWRLGPEDRMAMVAFGGATIDMLSGWSSDKAALAAALDRAAARPTRGHQRLAQFRSLAGDTNPDLLLIEPDQKAQELEVLAMRTSPETLSQLIRSTAAAAAALRAFELPAGRRILLLLSGGWSVATDPRLYEPLIAAANQLGYTLYPLDVATGEIDALRRFQELARPTGGKVPDPSSRETFAQVVQETASYYWLGFTPTGKPDDHPRQIEVRVRRTGLEARSRSYYSDLSRQTAAALAAESALVFASSSAVSGSAAAQLKVESGAARRIGRDEIEVPITLLLPMAALSFTRRGADFVNDTPLAIAAIDDRGRRAELPETLLHFSLPSIPSHARTLRYRTTLKLRRADQRLVFAVADAQNGGVLTAELTVHPDK